MVSCVNVNAATDKPHIVLRHCSSSEIMMVLGMQDGSVRLQPLETPGDISCMTDYWLNTMHDNRWGKYSIILPAVYTDLETFYGIKAEDLPPFGKKPRKIFMLGKLSDI